LAALPNLVTRNDRFLNGRSIQIMATAMLVRSRAEQALRESPIPALRRLVVAETEAQVVITGRVSSYYLKQLAQEAVLPVLEKRSLLNQVTVVRS